MNESEVVRELSRRTSIPETTAGAVFDAVRELIRDGAISDTVLRGSSLAKSGVALINDPLQLKGSPPEPLPAATHTDPTLVEELIARAKRHPLGVGFLLTGFLGSVAIALGAHAFTVEAARERLRREQQLKNEAKEPFEE